MPQSCQFLPRAGARLFLLIALAAATLGPATRIACGQSAVELFSKAPPDLDAALRKRVAGFFQAHVDGKFRQADQYVAEDSKDAFFEADKPRYKGFEIARINYSDDFTKATVVTSCDVVFRRAGREFPAKAPITTRWKVENGQWFWYFVPTQVVDTPWGGMRPGPRDEKGPAPAIPDINATALDILRKVRIDRGEVMLSSYQPAKAELNISNGLTGPVNVRVEYTGFPGFTAKPVPETIEAGKVGKILLAVDPKDKTPKPAVIVNIYVEPTAHHFPVKVTFDVPPEMKKMIPQQAAPAK